MFATSREERRGRRRGVNNETVTSYSRMKGTMLCMFVLFRGTSRKRKANGRKERCLPGPVARRHSYYTAPGYAYVSLSGIYQVVTFDTLMLLVSEMST